jgi:hypothetical protein
MFLCESTKIDEENMTFYRLKDFQKFALLDLTAKSCEGKEFSISASLC